jgi:predicted nucleic acid-binding protein
VTLVDTNVLVDILTSDRIWRAWSIEMLDRQATGGPIFISDIAYAELAPLFVSADLLDATLADLGIELRRIPQHALFVAGRAFGTYRRKGGPRTSLLADFFIGAHAEFEGFALLTRDARRYRTYFPHVELIAPD